MALNERSFARLSSTIARLRVENDACLDAGMTTDAITKPDPFMQRIDRRLQALGLTDEGASKRAGLHRDTIRILRMRPGSRPRSDRAKALAKALGCRLEWLLDGELPETSETSGRLPRPPTPTTPAVTLSTCLRSTSMSAWAAAAISCRSMNMLTRANGCPQTA